MFSGLITIEIKKKFEYKFVNFIVKQSLLFQVFDHQAVRKAFLVGRKNIYSAFENIVRKKLNSLQRCRIKF